MILKGIETILSGKLSHIVFRVIMNVIGFNLLRLFLNSEHCDSFEDFTAKTLRQRRPHDPNPKIIVYTKNFFATIYFIDLLSLLTKLSKRVLQKLSAFFDKLKRETDLDTC